MQRIFRYKPHLRPIVFDDETVFLIGGREHYLLKGALYAKLCPRIDGRNSVLRIINALRDSMSPPEVLYGLELLAKKGYITLSAASAAAGPAAYLAHSGIDPDTAAAVSADTVVCVREHSGYGAEEFSNAFAACGFETAQDGDLTLVLVDDYLSPELERINKKALARTRRWLPVQVRPSQIWIGPLLSPGAGPCWRCLAHRIRANRPVESYLRGRGFDLSAPAPGAFGPVLTTGANYAALAALRWLAQDITDRLLILDLADFSSTCHPVSRRPQCPDCGEPDLLERRAMQPIELCSRIKTSSEDGGHRCVPAQQTYAAYRHLIDPVSGIISSLGPLPGRDHALRPVFAASHFVTPIASTLTFSDFDQASLGKGRTPAQARTSALCEAVERWSALYQGDEARRFERFSTLGESAIEPNALMNFSARQFRTRDEWNESNKDPRRAVPLPFDHDALIDWTPLWSLRDARHRWLPTAYCYMHVPTAPEHRFCYYNPNGHASGNCLEEAILQAFLELVERDAVAIWWYNRLPRPGVDLDSFDDPYFSELQRHYRTLQWRVWVLDLTHDLGIPTFAALGKHGDARRWCIGFGCHLDARLAVQRALTEFNQLFDPGRTQTPWDDAQITDTAYLLPHPKLDPRRAGALQSVANEDIRDDILDCVGRAAALGLDTLVLDQTRPDVGLSVAMVAVPGLRHFWPRFGPGRLYQAPVRLGWRQTPLSEAELNPAPLFL